MSQLFLETISTTQHTFLSSLSLPKATYLTGGTALALQIGHRISYDLNFMTTAYTPQKKDFLFNQFSAKKTTQLLSTDTQYTALLDDIKLTLFEDTADILYPAVQSSYGTLLSTHDIFATKLYILGQRSTWRDYCDIAVLLKEHNHTLQQGIADAVRKYAISERWILEPLTFFDDVEMMPIEWAGTDYSNQEIKHILEKATLEYISK